MPLHDWKTTPGWSGLHHAWILEIARDLRRKMPPGYRAYIGTSPIVAADDPKGRPDVAVRPFGEPTEVAEPSGDPFQPDREVEVNIATLQRDRSVLVSSEGRLVAAVELVSVGNKDDDAEKAKFIARYLGYLTNGVHLLLVDLLPKPKRFSFADEIAAALHIPDEPPLAVPHVISYRVKPGDPGGYSFMAVKRHRVEVGQPLPPMPLSLNFPQAVWVDLESTYMASAADAYLT